MLTVQARLGMVLALLGQYGPAKQLLHEVAPPLREFHTRGRPVRLPAQLPEWLREGSRRGVLAA